MASEKPIPFTAPMIRALLDGRKSQTRRILKPQPERTLDGWLGRQAAPYAPGDRLWVKEGWADEHPSAVQEGRYSQPGRAGIPGPPSVQYHTIYRADGEPLQVWCCHDHPYRTLAGPADAIAASCPLICSNYTKNGKGIHWENSLHMPRWASRLTLIVTDVRVQRLQEIAYDDCADEGTTCTIHGDVKHTACRGLMEGFAKLWNSIHGSGAWEANPWVVALTFTVHSGNIDTLTPEAHND